MDIGQLREQHEELSRTAAQLARAVGNDGKPQGVGTLRWQLARQLMSHLALEDRFFYPAMQRTADEKVRTTAQRLQTEMSPLAEAFSSYMTRWNDDRLIREWAGFCMETREILAALVSRIEKEERILYPLYDSSRNDQIPVSRAG